ncbi:ribonuclease VapC [Allostella vacuolata]|nr:ribonuclease VapC [Stella vacuolata]
MKYLLDTNVLRELGRTRPHANVAAWLNTVDDADLAISALTVREVTMGIEKLRGAKPVVAAALDAATATIFRAFADRIVPVDRPVAAEWGRLLAENDRHVDDTGLAATARVHGLIVVTRNARDFAHRGVRLIDPFKNRPNRTSPT